MAKEYKLVDGGIEVREPQDVKVEVHRKRRLLGDIVGIQNTIAEYQEQLTERQAILTEMERLEELERLKNE